MNSIEPSGRRIAARLVGVNLKRASIFHIQSGAYCRFVDSCSE